jgi:hypothetical protein
MKLNLEPLGPVLGARIHDLDLSQSLSDEVIEAIVSDPRAATRFQCPLW